MLTTASFWAEAPCCIDAYGEELSLEEQLRIEAEIEEEQAQIMEAKPWLD